MVWNDFCEIVSPIKVSVCAASAVPWDVSIPPASNCNVHSSLAPAERVPLAHCCWLKVVTRADKNLFFGAVKLCPQCASCWDRCGRYTRARVRVGSRCGYSRARGPFMWTRPVLEQLQLLGVRHSGGACLDHNTSMVWSREKTNVCKHKIEL